MRVTVRNYAVGFFALAISAFFANLGQVETFASHAALYLSCLSSSFWPALSFVTTGMLRAVLVLHSSTPSDGWESF